MAFPVPEWSISTFDSDSNSEWVEGWDPRIRIVALLMFCFVSSLLHTLFSVLAALGLAVLGGVVARVDFFAAKRRIVGLAGFLFMLMLILPLTVTARPHDLIYSFSIGIELDLNMRGLLLACMISMKAIIVALMMEWLLGKAPFSVTVQALSHLKLSEKICLLLLLTHRYIFVLQQEAGRMYTAMCLRGFRPSADLDSLAMVGNFVGMLFVRSYERTQKVYDSMLIRGFNGTLPRYYRFRAQTKDWFFGGCWIIISCMILYIDWLWQ